MYKSARVSTKELEAIKSFIGSPENPKFFFTMTEINKIGINPKSRFNTPLGVFAYPLTEQYYDKLISNSLPYVKNAPYINVFTTSTSLINIANYSQSDLKRDTSTLKEAYGVTDDFIKDSFNTANLDNLIISKMWNLTRLMGLEKKDDVEKKIKPSILHWNKILRDLGYVGFYDPGLSRIHDHEPSQAVILDPSIIIPVATFLNPRAALNKYLFLTKEERNILQHKNRPKKSITGIIKSTKDKKKLTQLANSDDMDIRCDVAENQHTPAQALINLLNDPNPIVRSSAAQNENAPLQILINLLNDPSSFVRSNVVKNKKITDEKLLLPLLDDPDYRVKHSAIKKLTENCNSIETFKRITSDLPHTSIIEKNILITIAKTTKNYQVLGALLLQLLPEVTDMVIERFLTDMSYNNLSDRDKRLFEMTYSDTKENGKYYYFAENSPAARKFVAQVSTNQEYLTKLSNDPDPEIAQIAKNKLNPTTASLFHKINLFYKMSTQNA